MLRNVFLGNFNKNDLNRMDTAIKKAKDGLEETNAALKERTDSIKMKNRKELRAKLKSKVGEKRDKRMGF